MRFESLWEDNLGRRRVIARPAAPNSLATSAVLAGTQNTARATAAKYGMLGSRSRQHASGLYCKCWFAPVQIRTEPAIC